MKEQKRNNLILQSYSITHIKFREEAIVWQPNNWQAKN